MNHVLDSILDFFGSETVGIFTTTLSRIGIVEEEIARAKGLHQDRADTINNDAFAFCCLTNDMPITENDDLYRGYVRELIEHLATEKRIRTTSVQCVVALSKISLKAPLRHEYMLAYCLAFDNCMPQQIVKRVGANCLTNFNRRDAARCLEQVRSKIPPPTRLDSNIREVQ